MARNYTIDVLTVNGNVNKLEAEIKKVRKLLENVENNDLKPKFDESDLKTLEDLANGCENEIGSYDTLISSTPESEQRTSEFREKLIRFDAFFVSQNEKIESILNREDLTIDKRKSPVRKALIGVAAVLALALIATSYYLHNHKNIHNDGNKDIAAISTIVDDIDLKKGATVTRFGSLKDKDKEVEDIYRILYEADFSNLLDMAEKITNVEERKSFLEICEALNGSDLIVNGGFKSSSTYKSAASIMARARGKQNSSSKANESEDKLLADFLKHMHGKTTGRSSQELRAGYYLSVDIVKRFPDDIRKVKDGTMSLEELVDGLNKKQYIFLHELYEAGSPEQLIAMKIDMSNFYTLNRYIIGKENRFASYLTGGLVIETIIFGEQGNGVTMYDFTYPTQKALFDSIIKVNLEALAQEGVKHKIPYMCADKTSVEWISMEEIYKKLSELDFTSKFMLEAGLSQPSGGKSLGEEEVCEDEKAVTYSKTKAEAEVVISEEKSRNNQLVALIALKKASFELGEARTLS